MCGIVGVFNDPNAFAKVQAALAMLQNRGRDGIGLSNGKEVQHASSVKGVRTLSGNNILGHRLHAIVNHVPQPIQQQGIVAANCEIYNWKELNVKYRYNARNDAEFLLAFLEHQGINNLSALDGVYALAYWRDHKLILARDLLGEKPLWYSHTIDYFAFASEKKALEHIGCPDIQELNPRQIIKYTIADNSVEIISREFFTYLPEHPSSYAVQKKKTKQLLDTAITLRIPAPKFGLLFSGGIDSTYLAHYFKQQGYDFTCYTAVLDAAAVPSDLEAAQKVAHSLGLKLKIKKIKMEEIPNYLTKIVPLIEDSNVVKVGVALTFYVACEMAQEDGCKVIFSGLGSEEIFAGYERHKNSTNINQECLAGLRKMYERDLYRDDVITMHHGLELRLPYLDLSLVRYALKIPPQYKLQGEVSKFILRDIAIDAGIPEPFALRKKTAAQYGSRFDYALGKLARKNKYPSKSAYLRTFYPTHNLKLGVLFSSGKDSTYAAYIMKRQNYELSCLITMKSANPDSYMFQSAGTEMAELQAEAMGLPLVIGETTGEKEKELGDLEKTIRLAKEKFKLDGIVSGAMFSTYQRDRIENICDQLGLKIFAPLWHKPQEEEMQELLQHGFVFVLSAVAAEGLNASWLNKVITLADVQKLQQLHQRNKIGIAGEGGEFESVVLDCPLFQQRIELKTTQILEENKNTARLVIKKARLVPK